MLTPTLRTTTPPLFILVEHSTLHGRSETPVQEWSAEVCRRHREPDRISVYIRYKKAGGRSYRDVSVSQNHSEVFFTVEAADTRAIVYDTRNEIPVDMAAFTRIVARRAATVVTEPDRPPVSHREQVAKILAKRPGIDAKVVGDKIARIVEFITATLDWQPGEDDGNPLHWGPGGCGWLAEIDFSDDNQILINLNLFSDDIRLDPFDEANLREVLDWAKAHGYAVRTKKDKDEEEEVN